MLHREMLESENVPSLQPLVTANILPRATAIRAAKSGLRMEHLLLAFHRKSEEGVRLLFHWEELSGESKGYFFEED